jgi:TatD DNase family protein
LAKNQDFCAIGETGLDFFREWCPPPIQKSGFEFHLRLGRELELPVIIHCRDAGQAVLEVLRGTNSTVNGVMHCYSESPELVQAFLDLGLHISFAGNLTYPKSSPLREAASLVPSDRLLIETDAPFLSPQPKRGKRNEPAYIVHTLSCLAEVRGETVEALAKTTYKNSEALFGQNKQSN